MPNQVQTFLGNAAPIADAAAALNPEPADAPKVPFQTALKLNADQEKKLLDHAFTRYTTLNNESGRDVAILPNWWANRQSASVATAIGAQGFIGSDTFMGKRTRFDATFLNDVTWRPFVVANSIFNSSNIAVPIVRRVCRQMIARAKNAFFGSYPWFSVDPAPVPELDGMTDEEIADRIEKFCQFKLRESHSQTDKERAISRALILGECAVKTSYVVRDQIFNVELPVLHDITGEPVRAQDGNFITEQDNFVDAQDGSGQRVLDRDQITPEPDAPIWQPISLDRRQVLFEGPRSEPIYYKDFLCPITAQDVQTADCIVHLYDKPVMAFVDLAVKRGMVGDNTDDRIGAAQKMIALVKQLSNNSPQPKSASTNQNRPGDNYATPPAVETGGPVAEFAEFYLWFDVYGDGVQRNIMLVADRNTRAPIFYDHVANVTTDGLRPIEIVRINPVEDRWYGMGVMELFESYQTIIDLLVNRWNFSQSRAGRVDFWDPSATLEGDRDPNLRLNWGGTYSVKAGRDVEKVLKSVYLNDIKFDQIQAQIQFFVQLLLNESGVATANDGQAAGMESSELATGIIESTKSGDELFKPIIQDLTPSLTALVNREINVTLANLNPVECFRYLKGDTMGIDRITPDDVRGLKYECTISLTQHKNAEIIALSGQAAALVEKFYSLPPEIQVRTAIFYQRQLQALAPTLDAGAYIVPTMPTGIPAPIGGGIGQSGQSASGGGNAAAPAQLIQKNAQPTGQSAPGGTPAA